MMNRVDFKQHLHNHIYPSLKDKCIFFKECLEHKQEQEGDGNIDINVESTDGKSIYPSMRHFVFQE